MEIAAEEDVSHSRVSQLLKAGVAEISNQLKPLSRAETEVMKLTVKGQTNKVIASQLFVTEKTVKFHLTNIYRKCGVASRSELIVDFHNKGRTFALQCPMNSTPAPVEMPAPQPPPAEPVPDLPVGKANKKLADKLMLAMRLLSEIVDELT